jgi:hypothetical protein
MFLCIRSLGEILIQRILEKSQEKLDARENQVRAVVADRTNSAHKSKCPKKKNLEQFKAVPVPMRLFSEVDYLQTSAECEGRIIWAAVI